MRWYDAVSGVGEDADFEGRSFSPCSTHKQDWVRGTVLPPVHESRNDLFDKQLHEEPDWAGDWYGGCVGCSRRGDVSVG